MAAKDVSLQCCLAQYQNALDSPVYSRCNQITHILNSIHIKDLKYLFPKIVEDIFGFRNRADWGLYAHPSLSDFQALRSFLMPNGPLLTLAYKLLNDRHPTCYEFPISCLSASTRLALESGDIPSLYLTKVQRCNDQMLLSNLQLNSFQFYLFHFAYFIVRPAVRHSDDFADPDRCLYVHLLQYYLVHFLPMEGFPTPLPLEPLTPPTSPFRNTSWPISDTSPLSYSDSSVGYFELSPNKHSVLKPGIINISTSTPLIGNNKKTAQLEDWRSEEFLAIMAEIYLKQVSIDYPQSVRMMECHVPSYYHIWMVRIFLKHAHYFSNSLMISNHLLGQSPLVIDPMRQLKSIVFSRYLKKDTHAFLKMIFDRWPLDTSFKTPLEMWLSYIQPWRYIQVSSTSDRLNLSQRWDRFVADHLVFYTPMLLKVLCRFSRMDLSCPRNAFMLFRVAKVFAQDGLDEMITKAEHNLATNLKSSSCNWSFSDHSSIMFPSDPSHHRRELEDVSGYIPLFSDIIITQVLHLLREVALTLKRLKSPNVSAENGQPQGWFAAFIDFVSSEGSVTTKEINEATHHTVHLEESIANLCKLFKVHVPSLPEDILSDNASAAEEDPLKTCFYRNANGKKLPIMKNLWQMRKTVKSDFPYQNHPDRLPIRTYEVPCLVRMLADISAFYNEKYKDEIQSLYYRPSVIGRMFQQIFARPTSYYKTIKAKDMMSVHRELVEVPPRVELRFLANKQRLVFFMLYFVLFVVVLDYHFFLVFSVPVVLYVLWIFCKALLGLQ